MYEAADDELKVLNMQYTVAPEATNMLQNLGREQDDNLALLAKKLMLAAHPNPHYLIQDNILYKLLSLIHI